MNITDIDKTPSRPFKGFDWSEHKNVRNLIDALFEEYTVWYKSGGENRRIQGADKIKQHLTHFVLESYRTYQALPILTMGVHLGNSYYSENKGNRYHPNHLSYRVVKNVTDFLIEGGHLETPTGMGKWDPRPALRRTTRFRATSKLIDLCETHGINRFMIGEYPIRTPEIILLRKKKKRGQSSAELVDYKDTPFTIQARKNLKKINDFISTHCINLDITDEQHQELIQRLSQRDDPAKDTFVDFTKTSLKRIFNNSSFKEGGRLYGGWWQEIPSDYRALITIDSKRTIELDYSGMHFAIMYAELGMMTPMEDPYALEGYGKHLRKDIKTAFNIIINCASKKAAIGTIDGRIKNGQLSSELESGERLIQAFAETHPLIKDKIASGEGIKGQFIDSRIAERILLKGIEFDLCILPIHDGFITTTGDQYVLENIMKEAFEEITGQSALNKPESFNLSVLNKEGTHSPYWITRADGTLEKDGIIEGKATSFTDATTAASDLWDKVKDDSTSRMIIKKREKEWREAHSHYK